jgi:hypothetical protein
MTALTTQPHHADAIGFIAQGENKVNISIPYLNFIDDLVEKLNSKLFGNQITLDTYTVATLPTVPDVTAPGLIFVSDETGGAIPAFSDGTNWRRVSDRAIVS